MESKQKHHSGYFDHSLPGAEPFEAILLEKLDARRAQQSGDYRPRTHHLTEQGWARFTNRLFLETSPYLLQHAHNPVNWYPWGDEAFAAAKAEKKPVLVSIGYATCHWCHVMEEESFEDLEIAEYLNQHFICIKVDREERPDIDAIYMTAVQALTGSGGWPLNVMVTPEAKPFWGGTYFPARDGDRGAAFGFLSVIQRISSIYSSNPQEITRSEEQLTRIVQGHFAEGSQKVTPGIDALEEAAEIYRKVYDSEFGGIRGAPKFPSSLPLRLLMRTYQRTGEKDLLEMAETTLVRMAEGGIYDSVGGGFHRYTVDADWKTPHFEKMLYDNAQLAVIYIEAYQLTRQDRFKEVACDILDYILREMTAEGGNFYSATDADNLNEKGIREEGHYFVWSYEDLKELLNPDQFQLITALYGISRKGNFEGKNILHQIRSLEDISETSQNSASNREELKEIREILYRERNQRNLPICDDKTITSWNGLMISAFAKVGAITQNHHYIEAAEKAANFILDYLVVEGRLYRSYNEDKLSYKAFLTDYANFIASCLELFEATQKPFWLENAIQFSRQAQELFEDRDRGGFYMTGSDQQALLARAKPMTDGALPSGNGVMIQNLIRLWNMTQDNAFLESFEKSLGVILGVESYRVNAYPETLIALERHLAANSEIVVVSPSGMEIGENPFWTLLQPLYLPNSIKIHLSDDGESDLLDKLLPMVREKRSSDGKPVAFVCEGGSCHLPCTTVEAFEEELKKLAG